MIGLREWEEPYMRVKLLLQNLRKNYEFGIQYQYLGEKNEWLTAISYAYRKDENFFNPYSYIVTGDQFVLSTSREMGEFSQNTYRIVSIINREASSGFQQTKVELSYSEGKLWDAQNENVSFSDKLLTANFYYAFFKESAGKYPGKQIFMQSFLL